MKRWKKISWSPTISVLHDRDQSLPPELEDIYRSIGIDLSNRICDRLNSINDLLKAIEKHWDGMTTFLTAGGISLEAEPNDIDIWLPGTKDDIIKMARKLDWSISITGDGERSAITIGHPSKKVQLMPSQNCLDVIPEFDFSISQSGAMFSVGWGLCPSLMQVLFTQEFITSYVSKTIKYMGSETPFRTLCRVPKYVQKGYSAREPDHMRLIADVLLDTVKKGVLDETTLVTPAKFSQTGLPASSAMMELQDLFKLLRSEYTINRLTQ